MRKESRAPIVYEVFQIHRITVKHMPLTKYASAFYFLDFNAIFTHKVVQRELVKSLALR